MALSLSDKLAKTPDKGDGLDFQGTSPKPAKPFLPLRQAQGMLLPSAFSCGRKPELIRLATPLVYAMWDGYDPWSPPTGCSVAVG
jgi:hypothetical protein